MKPLTTGWTLTVYSYESCSGTWRVLLWWAAHSNIGGARLTNASLALCQRNVGLTPAFSASDTDCNCSVFDLLTTSATLSSTFSILVELQGLLGILGNPELQSFDRRMTPRLIFTIILTVSHVAGLLRDIGANYVSSTEGFQNLIKSGASCFVNKCAGHFWRSLWRDLRAGLWRDFTVLLRCFRANGAQREKLLGLLLI